MNLSIWPNFLDSWVEKFPNKTAIFYYDEQFTYVELQNQINQLAAGLKNLFQLKNGDVVAIQSSNTIEYVITLLACWKLGVTMTPLNPALKPEEISYQLKDSNAKIIIFEGYVAQKVREACEMLERPIDKVIFEGEALVGEKHFSDIFQTTSSHSFGEVPADSIALIIYTSGTTGKPKGVLLSHSNVEAMVEMSIQSLRITENDRSYLILPLFHVNALNFKLLSVLRAGGSVVLRKKFVLEEFLPCISKYKTTFTSGVPTIYGMVANLPEGVEHQYDLSSMRLGICGAAPVSISLFERFESRFPFKLIEGWGLSEGTCASTLNPVDGQRKVGSIGKPMPPQQVKVVNDKGEEVPQGQLGELIVKGPNVMQGYLNREEETKKTLKDGWLYTGDIGYQDEDGYFYIVDRKKDMIIRGGMNIYPRQIEEVIYQIPDVLEAAVIGIPDEKYGEEVVAFVALKTNSNLKEEQIIQHCQMKMANYRCPKKVYFVDQIPKNSVGKITKSELRKMVVEMEN